MDRQIALILKFIDQASAPLQAAAGAVNNAFKGMTSATSSATGSLTSAWGTAVGKITSWFGEMVDKGKWASLLVGGYLMNIVKDLISTASEFEKFSVATEFLTGSTADVTKFAQAIREMAVDSVFGLEQVTELGKRMVGNTKDVDRSTVAMKAMMDAVAATGGGYSELEGVVRAWIQTNSKAKASSEEMNRQFSNANIPVLRVLAESIVNNADNPLRKYIQTAGATGGANKTLTKSYETASDNIKILGDKVKIAQLSLDNYEKSSKKTEEGVLRHKVALESAQKAQAKANSTIAEYTAAQAKAGQATKTTTLTVEGVMAQLQEIGDLNIPGSIAADAITKALNEAYGGANQRLIQTFSGQLEAFKDRIKLAGLAFLGLDENFKVIEGSVFQKLTTFLSNVNNWLKENGEAIDTWGKKFGQSLPLVSAFATFLIGTFAGAIKGILGPALLVGAAFSVLGYAVGVLFDKLKEETGLTDEKLVPAYIDLNGQLHTANASYKDMSKFIGSAMVKQSDLGKNISDVRTETEKQHTALNNLKTAWEGVKSALEGLGGAFSAFDKATTSTQILSKWLTLAMFQFEQSVLWLSAMVLSIRALGEEIGAFWAAATGDDAAFVQHKANIDIINGKLTELETKYKTASDNIATTLAGNAITTNTWKDGVNASFNGVGINASENSTKMSSGFNTGMTSMVTSANTNMPLMSSSVATGFTSAQTAAETSSKGMYDSLFTNLSAMPPMAEIQSSSMMSSFKGGIESNRPSLDSTVSAMMKSVDSTLGSEASKASGHGGSLVSNFVEGIKSALRGLGGIASTIAGKMGLGDLKFEHGGIIPGPIGAPIPVIAHGGERVVPRSGADSGGMGGGIVINFNGGVVLDSEARTQELAEKIGRMLGRQNELARYGVAY
ncbi:MAG: hypothetical protein KCHDKBKB_00603 [Elusimicrobia bacterium]|nr:hypothetical protein [Elusimicrobiota bacterium]